MTIRMIDKKAAGIIARACMDALDFGTELRAGYVGSCFEVAYGRRVCLSAAKQREYDAVLLALENLGFKW